MKEYTLHIFKTLSVIFFLLIQVSCFEYPEPINYEATKIPLFPGPEDMLEIKNDTSHFILISCSSRRDIYNDYGNIIKYDLKDGISSAMPRSNEPDTLNFKPHGIDFKEINGLPYLYVVIHDDKKNFHPIVRYVVKADQLIFDRLFYDPQLNSPNAIAVLKDGSFFVCNDAGKRNSMIEKILRLKKGNILFYDFQSDSWKFIIGNLAYPAGLYYLNNKLYVSAALENKVYSLLWDGSMARLKKVVLEARAPDNIRFSNDELIITSHLDPVKFIKHTSNPDKKSPSAVYAYSPADENHRLVFWDDGTNISAASTSLIIDNNLYMSQIFEPWLLKVELPDSQ